MKKKADLTSRIIDHLQESGVKPLPRWRLVLLESLIWTVFTLILIMGSLAVAVIVQTSLDHEWRTLLSSQRRLAYVFINLPFFWLIGLCLLVIAADLIFRYTRHGYKINLFRLLALNIGVSLALGLLVYDLGWGERVDNNLAANLPYYRLLQPPEETFWDNPQAGFLWGTIKGESRVDGTAGDCFSPSQTLTANMQTACHLDITDANGKDWDVLIDQSGLVKGSLPLVGNVIRISGDKLSDGTFQASRIHIASGF